jgi:hypothetical protein
MPRGLPSRASLRSRRGARTASVRHAGGRCPGQAVAAEPQGQHLLINLLEMGSRGLVAATRYRLLARVSSENLAGVEAVPRAVLPGVTVRQEGNELIVQGEVAGSSAKDLNRSLLSALRRVEKRTRLRAEWTDERGSTERYFDYVLKSVRGP